MSALSWLGIGAFSFLCFAFGYSLARSGSVESRWQRERAYLRGRADERADNKKEAL